MPESLLPGIHEHDVPGGDAVEVIEPDGTVRTLPTFRAADGSRRVRFRTPTGGQYRIRADGEETTVRADGGTPPAPNVHREGGRLVDQDDRPFLWLADTWWYALCDRVEPAELDALAARRRAEGFTVAQVVAGLVPEVYAFDPLGELAGAWPLTRDLEALDPAWWEAADARILAIVRAGLVPAIVGGWSYYLADLGEERILRHWREMVARWSALPVVWCVAGEVGLPHYDQLSSPTIDQQVADLIAGWTRVLGELRRIDPYGNVRTIHPCPAFQHYSSTDVLGGRTDDIDLVWLQTGHADRAAIDSTLATLDREVSAAHGLPVVNSEVCYEGIASGSAETLQRFLFFSHLLSGAAGHSYGAQGLWAFRREQDPGPGIAWGDATWQEASVLPGARQLGYAAEFLRGLDWQALEPSQESISAHATPERRELAYAARTDDLLVAYFPAASMLPLGIGISLDFDGVVVRGLAPGAWELTWWNPRAGRELKREPVTVAPDGTLPLDAGAGDLVGSLPSREDWVLVLRRAV